MYSNNHTVNPRLSGPHTLISMMGGGHVSVSALENVTTYLKHDPDPACIVSYVHMCPADT